jgi:hypothetical protein
MRSRCDSVEHESCGPRTKRQVGEDRVQRVPEPHAVQGILRLPADGPGQLVRAADCPAQRFRNWIECRLIRESSQGIRGFHDASWLPYFQGMYRRAEATHP